MTLRLATASRFVTVMLNQGIHSLALRLATASRFATLIAMGAMDSSRLRLAKLHLRRCRLGLLPFFPPEYLYS